MNASRMKVVSLLCIGRMWGASIALATAFVASAPAQPVNPHPADYRRAWPSNVPVLRPDPVTGEAAKWEHWVYGRAFAERFEGFDPKGANPEMTPGVQAIAFRAYRAKIYEGIPELFRCEYDVYFDSRVQPPLGKLDASPWAYPPDVAPSYQQLRAKRARDAAALSQAAAHRKRVQSLPLMLPDGRLDGRAASFGAIYFPEVVPGVSMLTLGSAYSCEAIAPKRRETAFWFWLFGELTFNPRGGPGPHNRSAEFMNWIHEGRFDAPPAAEALKQGYARVPEALYEAVLPKVTLAKAINQCIALRAGYAHGTRKDVRGSKARTLAACDSIERKGEIFEITPEGAVRGWHKLGF